MSLVSPRGEQSSSDEVQILSDLASLGEGYLKIVKKFPDYTRRIKITSSEIGENNVLYIDLSLYVSNFWGYVKNGGGDIRITTSDGITEIAREVRSCDTTALTGEVYALMPTSPDYFYLYYGNPNAEDYADTDTYGKNNVWANALPKYVSSNETKGGVVSVIDSATGDIAITDSGWLEDKKYGWYAQRKTSSISAKIDNSVLYEGHKTIKIEKTSDTGTVYLSLINREGGSAGNSKHLLPVKPSTEYKVSVVVKGENITNLGFIWQGHTDLFSRINYTTATSKNGTYDFSLVEYTFTTQSTAVFLNLMFRIDVAGNGQKAWIAPYSLKLEEVSTITAPSASKLYPKVTAVSSSNNIDQNLDPTGAYANTYAIPTSINEGATHRQTFTPTKKNEKGIRIWPIQKGTGDWTLTIHNASNNVVGSPVTIANASVVEGALLSFLTDWTWTAGNYHFHITSTVNNGTLKTNTSNDLEACSFTTLYQKNTTNFTVRTDTETMSVTAPTTDGWANGTVIDTATLGIAPLSLTAGVNNIYYSSNGPATADGEVDPSLQCVITGNSYPVFPPETSEYETSNINFGEIAVDEGQEIVKITTEEDAYYDFGTTRVKFKVKDQNGNFLYLTFKDGAIVVSTS